MAVKSNELQLIRVFEAPVKMVWEAWADPQQAAKWWGPRGWSITTHKSDIRTGGEWEYTMYGPEGVEHENVTKFLQVEKYQKMVYDHGGGRDRPPLFRVTVTFEENNGKTRMNMIMSLADEAAAKEIKKHIKRMSGDSTWDRLAEYLLGDDPFVINRTFAADQKTMFQMFADPNHLAKWLPPTGMQMTNIKADIKPGGQIFYSMADAADGNKMYGRIKYIEVQPTDRLVYTQIFTDEHGRPSRHPFAPTWPETMLTTVTLTPESPTETRVTIKWEVYGRATGEERATFAKEKPGMTMGWTGSFDKLDDYLRRGQA